MSTPVLVEVDADYLKGLEEYYKTGTNFEYTYHRNAAQQLKLKDDIIAGLQDENRDLKDKIRQLLEEIIHLEEQPQVSNTNTGNLSFKVRASRLAFILQKNLNSNLTLTFDPNTKELLEIRHD